MTDNSPEAQRDLTQWTALETLPDREILSGRVGKDLVFVWRAGDIIRVYGATCPHLGAPLNEGLIEGSSLRCPWHHACFDLLTRAATAAPAVDMLTSYPVELQTGNFAIQPATTPSRPANPAVLARAEDDVMAIVGGGAAGFAAADTLRREGRRGGIAMFSDEAAAPYDRTLLTKDYLDGNFGEDRLPIARHSLDALGVHFEGEAHVASIDVENKRLKLANGGSQSYSKLLLATGSLICLARNCRMSLRCARSQTVAARPAEETKKAPRQGGPTAGQLGALGLGVIQRAEAGRRLSEG